MQSMQSLTQRISDTLRSSTDGQPNALPSNGPTSATGRNPAGTGPSSTGGQRGEHGSVVVKASSPQNQSALPTVALPSLPASVANWLDKRISSAASVGLPNLTENERANLVASLPILERQVIPASLEAFMIAMDQLFAWAELTGLTPDVAAATALYRETLADLPADLLVTAIGRTIQTHQYHNLPKPADIRKQVAEDMARRRSMLNAARSSLKATRSISHLSYEERFQRMAEQAKNWPDPKAKRTVEIKPLYVRNPETESLIQAAKGTQTGDAA